MGEHRQDLPSLHQDSSQQPSSTESTPTDLRLKEAHDDFERAYSKIKPSTRRRKPSYSFLEEAEKYSKLLRQQMIAAAEQDITSHENHQPSLEKFRMLPSVVEAIQRKDMEELLLDNGILDAVRIWLEPFDDGTLPAVDLKLTLLDLLAGMNIDTDHLRESGVGRVIMFMYKCPREIAEVKRKSGSLISKWCKPILRSSAGPEPAAGLGAKLMVEAKRNEQKIDLSRPHASIPKPALFDYPVRPRSKIDVAALKDQAKDGRGALTDISGKVKRPSTLSKLSVAGKTHKPSIEGKGLL